MRTSLLMGLLTSASILMGASASATTVEDSVHQSELSSEKLSSERLIFNRFFQNNLIGPAVHNKVLPEVLVGVDSQLSMIGDVAQNGVAIDTHGGTPENTKAQLIGVSESIGAESAAPSSSKPVDPLQTSRGLGGGGEGEAVSTSSKTMARSKDDSSVAYSGTVGQGASEPAPGSSTGVSRSSGSTDSSFTMPMPVQAEVGRPDQDQQTAAASGSQGVPQRSAQNQADTSSSPASQSAVADGGASSTPRPSSGGGGGGGGFSEESQAYSLPVVTKGDSFLASKDATQKSKDSSRSVVPSTTPQMTAAELAEFQKFKATSKGKSIPVVTPSKGGGQDTVALASAGKTAVPIQGTQTSESSVIPEAPGAPGAPEAPSEASASSQTDTASGSMLDQLRKRSLKKSSPQKNPDGGSAPQDQKQELADSLRKISSKGNLKDIFAALKKEQEAAKKAQGSKNGKSPIKMSVAPSLTSAEKMAQAEAKIKAVQKQISETEAALTRLRKEDPEQRQPSTGNSMKSLTSKLATLKSQKMGLEIDLSAMKSRIAGATPKKGVAASTASSNKTGQDVSAKADALTALTKELGKAASLLDVLRPIDRLKVAQLKVRLSSQSKGITRGDVKEVSVKTWLSTLSDAQIAYARTVLKEIPDDKQADRAFRLKDAVFYEKVEAAKGKVVATPSKVKLQGPANVSAVPSAPLSFEGDIQEREKMMKSHTTQINQTRALLQNAIVKAGELADALRERKAAFESLYGVGKKVLSDPAKMRAKIKAKELIDETETGLKSANTHVATLKRDVTGLEQHLAGEAKEIATKRKAHDDEVAALAAEEKKKAAALAQQKRELDEKEKRAKTAATKIANLKKAAQEEGGDLLAAIRKSKTLKKVNGGPAGTSGSSTASSSTGTVAAPNPGKKSVLGGILAKVQAKIKVEPETPPVAAGGAKKPLPLPGSKKDDVDDSEW